MTLYNNTPFNSKRFNHEGFVTIKQLWEKILTSLCLNSKRRTKH